jgi:murein DD-endopeptidase MepM/ murein hydrolase activator NlpD
VSLPRWRENVYGLLALALVIACSGDSSVPEPPGQASTPAAVTTVPAAATATPVAASPSPTPGLIGTIEPQGLPLDPSTRLGIVLGAAPDRALSFGGGPRAGDYSRDDQPAGDPERANRSGWNCRVHQEYEGQPAVDWYVPPGTPVVSTMDGTARLFVVTTSNPFDLYGVNREPYLGHPDRSRAPLSPFPGPGGGKGVFVQVENAQFVTEYAHLDAATFSVVPLSAFIDGYGPGGGSGDEFRPLRGLQTFTEVARWEVRAGDVVGLSGDTGYSEAPHLHYTVRRAGGPLLCPTTEAGFPDNGWLFR